MGGKRSEDTAHTEETQGSKTLKTCTYSPTAPRRCSNSGNQVSFTKNVSSSFALAPHQAEWTEPQPGPGQQEAERPQKPRENSDCEPGQNQIKPRQEDQVQQPRESSQPRIREDTKFRRRTRGTDSPGLSEEACTGQNRRRSERQGTGQVRTHGGSWPAKGTTPER